MSTPIQIRATSRVFRRPLREETVRVTLNLNKKSVDFFKVKARENGVPYQSMIRKVLDIYAEQFYEPLLVS